MSNLVPFPKLERVAEKNLARFDESGDLFKAFRRKQSGGLSDQTYGDLLMVLKFLYYFIN